MALSIATIYRPLNEFFINRFGEKAGAPVTFRFGRVPRLILDSDLLLPTDPSGPSSTLAQELLSDVVDGVTRLDADGRTVSFSAASLAELYYDETVSPAVCLLTPSDAATTARIQAFESLKSEALRQWQSSARASLLLGAGITYRLSVAQPQRWWDKADAGVWTSQSFHVDAAATPAASTPEEHVLRRRLNDATINSVLQSKLQPRLTEKIASTTFTAKARAPRAAAAKLASANVAELNGARPIGHAKGLVEAKRPLLLEQLNTSALNLSFHERRVVQDALSEEATPAPVTTSDVTISFDYCVVDVRRPWLHEGLLRNTAWCVPGVDKGKLSANDGHGLPALLVGFVAIKNLKIKAPWTPEDLTNLQESVQFGPFAFDSDVIDSAVGYPGIQIIGWILQTLPELPPQDVR